VKYPPPNVGAGERIKLPAGKQRLQVWRRGSCPVIPLASLKRASVFKQDSMNLTELRPSALLTRWSQPTCCVVLNLANNCGSMRSSGKSSHKTRLCNQLLYASISGTDSSVDGKQTQTACWYFGHVTETLVAAHQYAENPIVPASLHDAIVGKSGESN
jgi:hypothetical protein